MDQNGSDGFTIAVSDGVASDSIDFLVSIEPVDDAPLISGIADASTVGNSAVTIDFTLSDVDDAVGSLALSAVSSVPGLVPPENIVFGGTGSNRTLTATPAANQSGKATLTVAVSDGVESASASFELTVLPEAAPAVTRGADISGVEGQSLTAVLATYLETGIGKTYRARIDWGDGVAETIPVSGGTVRGSHTYTDDGVYAVQVSVDAGGAESSVGLTSTIANAKPVVQADGEEEIDEGQVYHGNGSFTDAGMDTWSATVDYGDGSGPAALSLNPDRTFTLSHRFERSGIFQVRVTVTDDDGGSGSVELSTTVHSVLPPPPDAGAQSGVAGEDFTLILHFDGLNPLDSHTITLQWEEGVTETVMLRAGQSDLVLAHVFSQPGNFSVIYTLTSPTGEHISGSAAVTIMTLLHLPLLFGSR